MLTLNESLRTPGTLLIGFGHRARQGKDYLAQEVHCLDPRRTKIYSLAAAMKAWARVQGWMTEKDGALLQMLGTDIYRNRVDPMTWIRTLSAQIREEAPPIALITDIRFKNEAEWVTMNGGTLIKVSRWNADGTAYVATDRPSDHPSETELSQWPWNLHFRAESGNTNILKHYAAVLHMKLFELEREFLRAGRAAPVSYNAL